MKRIGLYAFIVAVGGLLSSYHFSVISGILLFLDSSYLAAAYAREWIVSSLLLGSIAGAAFAGKLGDRFGRKKALLFFAALLILGGVILLFARNMGELVIGRILAGISIGGFSVVIPLYLAEISPSKRRGTYVSFYQFSITVGVLFAYFVNWMLADTGAWRLALLIPFGISISLFLALFFITDSSVKCDKEETSLFTRKNAFLLFTGILLSAAVQLCGINAIIYYGPSVFQEYGSFSKASLLLISLGIGILNLVATLLAMLLIDRYGRRSLLLSGLSVIALSLFLLKYLPCPFCIPLIFLYIAAFAVSLGVVVWVVLSEIYPAAIRARAMSLATIVNWGCNFLVALTFPGLSRAIGTGWVFVLYGIFAVCTWLFVYFFVPETKGKPLPS